MTSTQTMLKQLDGLLGTDDLNDWESEFVRNVCARVEAADGHTFILSEKQLSVIERIWSKHFA